MTDSLLPLDLATPPYTPTEQEKSWLPHGWKNATGENVKRLCLALHANPAFRTAAVRIEQAKPPPIRQVQPSRAPLPRVELFGKAKRTNPLV